MATQSGKINKWEREICFRLKAVRENLRWSQQDFSEHLEITRNQLASIECGRTPVRYEIAWRLRESFGISLKWLEEGDGFADNFLGDSLPRPDSTGLRRRALLSAVVEKAAKSNTDDNESPARTQSELFAAVISTLEGKEKTTGKEDVANRVLLESQLKILVEGWMERVPIGRAFEFVDKLHVYAEKFIRALPEEVHGEADLRGERIMWERVRSRVAKKNFTTKPLTKNSLKGKSDAGMKSEIQKLIERVKRKASKPGAKVALAKELQVAPARISEWLSGEKEPGGNYTLRLLNWVERQ